MILNCKSCSSYLYHKKDTKCKWYIPSGNIDYCVNYESQKEYKEEQQFLYDLENECTNPNQ